MANLGGRRSPSPSSSRAPVTGTAGSIFPKIPFLSPGHDKVSVEGPREEMAASTSSTAPPVLEQRNKRYRRGSLRKVALLSRGAQREDHDGKSLDADNAHGNDSELSDASYQGRLVSGPRDASRDSSAYAAAEGTSLISKDSQTALSAPGPQGFHSKDRPTTSSSTTDEDDVLQIALTSGNMRQPMATSSRPDSYFAGRRSSKGQDRFQQAKSPLSYSGMASASLPTDADWDNSETEWWGWVVLTVTWFVFVVGMGSCLDVWSWAWDVGTTPYAPPELEDDPTLPIVGYYPALMILTGVMAWVWVVVAWVGMKYFRHAKISGD